MPKDDCGTMQMIRRLSLVLLVTVLASGCAASRAFRRGQEAIRSGDLDAAVTYFTKAVQDNPDSTEYKINLARAQEEAARAHVEKARDLEQKDQLESALGEYRKSQALIGTDRVVQAKVAELERKIRERIEATRPKPQLEQLRNAASS